MNNPAPINETASPSRKHCIVLTCFSENQPGFLDFSYRIRALAQHYRLTILSQDPLRQPELQIHDATYQAFGRGHGKLGWLRYLWQCAAYVRRRQPDVLVLMHSSAAPVTLLVGRIPTCLYWNEHPTNLIHLPERFSPLRYWLGVAAHRLLFAGARRARLLMPIGEEHRDDLLARGCTPERMRMLYMGVADEFSGCAATRGTRIDKPLTLIYIGSVSKPRGRDVMLEAMAQLAITGVLAHLTIVGADEEQLAYCRERVRQFRLENSVRIVGRVTGSEIPRFLAESDAGICLWEDKPWWRFNPPTKLFEYLAAGLAVVASDIRTHTRYIENGRNGVIFEYGARDLARAITELAHDRARLAQLKLGALQSGGNYLWSGIEPHFLGAVAQAVRA